MEQKNSNYQTDLSVIRTMMERSSRFISLNGLAGVFAGLYAIAGAVFAYFLIPVYQEYKDSGDSLFILMYLLADALIVFILAVATAAFFTMRKSRKNGLKIWDSTTRRLIVNFAVPLVAGGAFCLLLLWRGNFGYLAPTTLVFYGLALFCAGNFTFSDIKILGMCEVVLGLLSLAFLGYGLLFWTLGFGVLHITYGIVMYVKYK
ncbi:MAG: hypothetical protein LBB41_06125 [Prevotellaceae bacterium]|jgi:hypothetical protein|nr:hypothetical protein [Prevotellaceae bacterium]